VINTNSINLKEKDLKKSEEDLKRLLLELFRFDLEDLDFGIYRIMNFKRDEIKKFIEEDLLSEVEKEFKELYEEDKKDLKQEIEDLREKIRDALGGDALDDNGKLNPLFETTKLGKEYNEKLDEIKNVEEATQDKIEIFGRVYDFFLRYYVDGDLIPIRRYTKSNDYIIPYNGEEVTFYWATKDQYYVKTAEYFQRYTFSAGGYEINFNLREAHIDKNNVKEKDKFFILPAENFIEIKDRTINIYFEYRELTADDYKNLDLKEITIKTTVKKKLVEDAVKRVKNELNDRPDLIRLLDNPFKKKSGEESEKTVLETHLNIYVEKNTKDYFIHKDLKNFLLTELDFYIKNEMLLIEDIEDMNETVLKKVMRRVKVFKNLCTKIIEFLAEIENFEKMLWEKKKFVLDTEYVITLDKIKEYAGEKVVEGVLEEILNNERQVDEWKNLFGFEVKSKNDLIEKNTLQGIEWKKLPIDTKYFDEEFKWRLLTDLTKNNELDDILDGVLIKSENWQALNLLSEKYCNDVQTIYIDPPFNKENEADYPYKVNYKDSTWASILENRLRPAKSLLSEKGSIFVRCDYNGNWIVRPLMNEIFGEENFRNELAISRISKQDPKAKKFNVDTDSLFYYSKSENSIFKTLSIKLDKAKKERWHAMDSQGQGQALYIFGYLFEPPEGRHWTYGQENIKKMESTGCIKIVCKKCKYEHTYGNWEGCPRCGNKDIVSIKYFLPPTDEKQISSNWTNISGFTSSWDFSTENSEQLLKRVIDATSIGGNLVLDFFLGSGTTTAVAHKLGRKWLGVEMGEHFWTVVLPRMKKVLFYDKSQISKEEDVKKRYNPKTAGGFFKYQVLEQYEDSLNNIVFAGDEQRQAKLREFEDYIFHILEYGTRGCASRLSIDQFKKPFDYKMEILENGISKTVNVDLVETFNYLIGLNIKRICIENANSREYAWIVGEHKDKSLAVAVWRETENLDLVEDKKYIENKIHTVAGAAPDYIYINGDSYVENAILIETEFIKLVGA